MEIKRNIRTVDLEGRIFGKLTVVEFAGYRLQKDGSRKALWLCRCECGNVKVILANSLKSKHTQSCGCLFVDTITNNNIKNTEILIGEVFTDLVVIEFEGYIKQNSGRRLASYLCRCKCGQEISVLAYYLKNKDTKSCGCLKLRTGKDSPIYNHNKTNDEREVDRSALGYRTWRKSVYERDNYTCQCCGDSKGRNLNAHHIKNWADNPELRYDIDNGITLCSTCHKVFHKIYKKRNNNKNQLIEFLNKKTNKTNKEIK